MPRLVITRSATANPMGAEVYQHQVASRADAALAEVGGAGWEVMQSVVRSLRSPLPGDRRLPMGWLTTASPASRRAVGRVLYPRGAVVHRMNLEIPPSPHADIVTLHDVVAWRYPDESRPVRAAVEEARRAAAVICVSSYSAQQAVDLLGIRDPHVVHNGVDESYFDAAPLTDEALAALGVRPPFVLVTGGASERKNLAGMAAAWSLVHDARPELTLVLTGSVDPRRTRLFARSPMTHLTGRVPGELMPGLVAAALAVVVPSLEEGFGLPALEGMAAGVPVVAAHTSSLPEVVGDGAVLVEPTASDIAEGVLWATSGDAGIRAITERGRRRAGRFTWSSSVQGHARIWTSVTP